MDTWQVRTNFEEAGGVVLDNTAARGIDVYDDIVVLRAADQEVTGRLLLDCMGNASPIVLQVNSHSSLQLSFHVSASSDTPSSDTPSIIQRLKSLLQAREKS